MLSSARATSRGHPVTQRASSARPSQVVRLRNLCKRAGLSSVHVFMKNKAGWCSLNPG